MSQSDDAQAAQGEEELQAIEGEYIAAHAAHDEQSGESAESEAGIDAVQMIASMLHLSCAIIAPAWEVSESEAGALAAAYVPLVEKYMPGGLRFGPELQAIAVTMIVFGPRIGKPRKNHTDSKTEKNADNEGATGGV